MSLTSLAGLEILFRGLEDASFASVAENDYIVRAEVSNGLIPTLYGVPVILRHAVSANDILAICYGNEIFFVLLKIIVWLLGCVGISMLIYEFLHRKP